MYNSPSSSVRNLFFFFLVTCFPNSSIPPIVGGSFRLISEIAKVSIKIYHAQVNKYLRHTLSKWYREVPTSVITKWICCGMWWKRGKITLKNKAGWKLHTIVSWTANVITPLKHGVKWEPEGQSIICHGLKMSMYSLNFSLYAALAQHWLNAPLSAWTAGITQKGWLENNSTEMPNLYIDYLRDSWKYWKKPWT